MEDIKNRLIDKSIEAFIMGLEIYNKPTIRYRIEGFSFFICNAWELMLKAVLIDRGDSIYFLDKPNRTISLEVALRKVYPDEHTRIRVNLEKIIELRNISTHYITEDYEVKYAPLFQACVLNYTNETSKFHKRDVTEYIALNFLTLSAHYEPLTNEQIKLKYTPEIAEKLIQQFNDIDVLTKEIKSDKFAIDIRQNLYITKKKSEADFIVSIGSQSDNKVSIVKELKDPSNTHKYSFKNVINVVNERGRKSNKQFTHHDIFNSYVLTRFIEFYDVKNTPKYSYKHKIGKQESYTYSEELIDFILKEIKINPNLIKSLKDKKKITPGT